MFVMPSGTTASAPSVSAAASEAQRDARMSLITGGTPAENVTAATTRCAAAT